MNVQMSFAVGPEGTGVAARSRLYQHFSRAVCYPEAADPWCAILDYHARTFAGIAADLPYALALPATAQRGAAPGDLQTRQLTYTHLFEAAGDGCAIPLNESEYAQAPRKVVWEDTIRFYEHFGLRYDGTVARNGPDHLGTELECLHYLSFLQSGLTAGQPPVLRAQSDFIERHLLSWLPRVVERVRAARDNEPYAGIMGALLQFVEADHLHLRAALGIGAPAQVPRRTAAPS